MKDVHLSFSTYSLACDSFLRLSHKYICSFEMVNQIPNLSMCGFITAPCSIFHTDKSRWANTLLKKTFAFSYISTATIFLSFKEHDFSGKIGNDVSTSSINVGKGKQRNLCRCGQVLIWSGRTTSHGAG